MWLLFFLLLGYSSRLFNAQSLTVAVAWGRDWVDVRRCVLSVQTVLYRACVFYGHRGLLRVTGLWVALSGVWWTLPTAYAVCLTLASIAHWWIFWIEITTFSSIFYRYKIYNNYRVKYSDNIYAKMDIKQNRLGNDFNDPVNPLSVAGG